MMFISVVYFMTLDQFYFSRYRMNLRLISCRINELYLKYFSLYALCYKGLCITQSSHKVSITNKKKRLKQEIIVLHVSSLLFCLSV